MFLPAHTDSLLLSLHRTKANRAASPTFSDSSTRSSSTYHIDVRKLTLRAFRDSVILPICHKLHGLVTSSKKLSESVQEHQPRLQQMSVVIQLKRPTAHSSSKAIGADVHSESWSVLGSLWAAHRFWRGASNRGTVAGGAEPQPTANKSPPSQYHTPVDIHLL